MKKTLFLLLAIPGLAVADAETTVTAPSDLTMHEVTFDGATTLTGGNQAMTWDGTNAYNAWYMETILTASTGDAYQASITTGTSAAPSNGLSVSSKNGWVTIGKGHQTVYDGNNALSFDNTHLLTFAYYNGEAYMGNLITGEYIKCTPTGVTTTMTSGTSRAWSNNGATQIGATKIASLDGISTDIVTLVTQGTNTAAASGTQFYAVGTSQNGSTALVVNSGSASGWTGAFGNAANPSDNNNNLTLTGSVSMRFTDDFKGEKTAFGIVNAGAVTGDVSLFFDAEGASYGSFTGTNAASIVGAYNGTIGGTFRAVINAGTFQNDIYGGIHTGETGDSVGATAITVNGGTIKGNVYAGGRTGSIAGDTSVTITALTPFASHTADNIISAGGVGGTIGGDSTVTLSGIENGSYAGTISGGANVAGSSTLNVASSQVTVGSVSDFDRLSLTGNSKLRVSGKLTSNAGLSIEGDGGDVTLTGSENAVVGTLSIAEGNSLTLDSGSGLTVNGAIHNDGEINNSGDINLNISSASGLVAKYNPDELNREDNGLGSAIIDNVITGNGQFVGNGTINATYNGNSIDVDVTTGQAVIQDAIYYVMAPLTEENVTNTADENQIYRLLPTKVVELNSVVNVGNHGNDQGPMPYAPADNALGYYIGEKGTLCVSADKTESGISVQKILSDTQGNGDLILRAPGYNQGSTTEEQTRWDISFNGKSQLTGGLYLSPYVQNATNGEYRFQNGIDLYLNDGADISSFSSVVLGYPQTIIHVSGTLGKDAKGNHFNNVSAYGAGDVFINYESEDRQELVLGGSTTLQPYKYLDASYADAGSTLHLTAGSDVDFRIKHLTSGENANSTRPTTVMLGMAATEVDSVLTIDSFDYDGFIYLQAMSRAAGSLTVNITLLSGQELKDSQVYRYSSKYTEVEQSLNIKGEGRYILGEGHSMTYSTYTSVLNGDYNFGVLDSTWTGTVEVNNLNASGSNTNIAGIKIADYGNENSSIHFKGFKGYLTDDIKDVQIASDLILENTENTVTPNGYEICNGYTDQIQTYSGDISGNGDFVISTDVNMQHNIQGDVSEWKEGAELKVSAGNQKVNFSGNATEINADVLATGGTMDATISNDNAVTVNGAVEARGGALNMSVSTARGTTFTNSVAVSSLSVSDNSVAHLQATSTAGNVKIDRHGEGATSADLSDGLTIAGDSVSGGHIENAAITHLQAGGTVLLEDLTAGNLYLYGDGINFSAQEDQSQFTYTEQKTYGSLKVNEVVFNTSVLNGMTLSDDGASLGLTVNNNIAASTGDIIWSDAHQISVTIHLKGFTIEKLTDRPSGTWDWDTNGLSIHPMADVALLDDTADVTVVDLLAAEYDFVVYEQNLDGLTIRMYNIPEPTTATLSLLALAALAARRRRR